MRVHVPTMLLEGPRDYKETGFFHACVDWEIHKALRSCLHVNKDCILTEFEAAEMKEHFVKIEKINKNNEVSCHNQ